MDKDISIIIINYNGIKYLKKCFDSIIENTFDLDYEVIVFDNASMDESCNFIATNYPDFILIKNDKNLGFGKGNNEAVKYAKGKHLFLLNNDTILLSQMKDILDFYKRIKYIGILTIKMLNGQKKYIPSAGKFPNLLNMLLFKYLFYRNIEFRRGRFRENLYETDWVSGSFMLIDRNLYEKVEGFDERYFMYVEDVDLCKRVKDLGYKNYFTPIYSYIHFVGFKKSRNHQIIESYKKYLNIHNRGFHKKCLSFSLKLNVIIKKLFGKYD